MQLSDRGDGTYTIQFVPSHEGTTSVHVMLDGAHVRGSPMAISVHRDVDELARGALTGKLSSAVTGLRRGLAQTRRQQHTLRAEAEGLLQFVPVLVNSAASDLTKLMSEQQALLREAREAVHREGGERRRLHNLVQELRGNIRVYVRVKPLTADEAGAGMTPVLTCSADKSRIECNAGTSTKAFDFDRVFGERASQAEVFGEVAGLVTSALDGCAAAARRNRAASASARGAEREPRARAGTTCACSRTARRAAARRTRWRAPRATRASTSAPCRSSSASSTRNAARATSTPSTPPSLRSTTSRRAQRCRPSPAPVLAA